MLSRRALFAVVLTLMLAAAGCVRNVPVPPLLPVGAPLTIDALVSRVNGQAQRRTVSAPVTLQFRDLRGATTGKNKQYPAADGRLILEEPELIRLQVKFPVVGTKIADMASNGQTFALAVLYPENKRKFIRGSNAGHYKRVENDTQSTNPELQRAGTLANIRPQHLTDAFLIKPIALNGAQTVYFLDEVLQTEHDTRPNAKAGAEVERTYYVLALLERIDSGPEARVVRRLWFDRTKGGTPLARQELYEAGRLATLVTYDDYTQLSSGDIWPMRVRIERVMDQYSVDVLFEQNNVEINGEVPDTAFQLENTEHLQEVDLDRMPDVAAPGRRTSE
jgi:hypothetical protein